MGQDPGATGTGVTESSDPAEIREQIEATREELGDTVTALAAKADVKAQAKEKIEGVKATLTGKKEDLLGKAKEGSPESAVSAAARASDTARRNPAPVAAAGAFAFGFLAGWVLRR